MRKHPNTDLTCKEHNVLKSSSVESIKSYHIIHFLLFAVPGIILSQSSHQDHGHQAHQENDHHEGVEN